MSSPKSDGFEYLIFGIMFLYMFNIISLLIASIWWHPAGLLLFFNIAILAIALYRARYIIKGLPEEAERLKRKKP